ncbi:hypothetical protein [Andreprevotia lacus]|uniref:hypothetical protein n=1 Tax=Andreprevotia lacus TaxID=1121000 RepID=UPI00111C7D6C|nr:hypothetical protein [Andreprevotia lacus]
MQTQLMRQVSTQDADTLALLLAYARTYQLPVTDSFAFWLLAYPGQHILRIVTPTHTCFMRVPADRPAADLYHGATLRIGLAATGMP